VARQDHGHDQGQERWQGVDDASRAGQIGDVGEGRGQAAEREGQGTLE
jgi:hypothetical protein